MGLEKCMRVVPHDQNTGGFFIALLRKVHTPYIHHAGTLDRRNAGGRFRTGSSHYVWFLPSLATSTGHMP